MRQQIVGSRQYAVSTKIYHLLLTIFLPTAYFLLLTAYSTEGFGQYGQVQGSLPAPGMEKPVTEVPTTERPVEIWVFPSTQRLVTGKDLLLTVQVIWRLGINVVIEELEKVDMSPFKMEKVTIGERQIFENERDFRIVQYILSLPERAKEGEYIIPSFAISYSDEVEKRTGRASSSPVVVRKVPILAQAHVDRDVIETGDIIRYSLTILHEKDTEVLLKNIERPNFEPFTLLSINHRKVQTPHLQKTIIDYALSIYELGGEKKYEIPELSIYYYKTGQTKKGVIETKEIRTPAIPIIINKLLKTVDVPLEGVKGPVTYRRAALFAHSYVPISFGITLLLLLFGQAGFRRIRESLFPPQETPVETPELARAQLKSLLSAIQSSDNLEDMRQDLEGLDKALRYYLGSLAGLSRERSLSLSSAQLLEILPPELSSGAKGVLGNLDRMIFGGRVEKKKIEEVFICIEELLKNSKPTK
ncbi:MAG TPA: hypothetical protein ACFYD3_04330 [Candidatus Hypogeohydataceae bacterium YC41]